MNLPPRQQQILELVRERGYVSIEEMAQLFVVTPQTIRRDINQLADANLLRRYHGGAAYDSSVENTAYAMRADQMRDEKQRIGEAIAAQIPDHASLFINIGTTTESIARALLNHSHLKIITNNLNVATMLSAKDDFDVLLTGGNVRRDGGVVGNLRRDGFTDALFLVAHLVCTHGIRGVLDTGVIGRAAVVAAQQIGVRQLVDIAADGLRGDNE